MSVCFVIVSQLSAGDQNIRPEGQTCAGMAAMGIGMVRWGGSWAEAPLHRAALLVLASGLGHTAPIQNVAVRACRRIAPERPRG